MIRANKELDLLRSYRRLMRGEKGRSGLLHHFLTPAAACLLVCVLIWGVLLLMNIWYATRTLGMRFTFKGLEWSMFKAIAVFSFWIFLNQIFDLVNNNVPNFLLGAMASATAVAVFAIALQIRNIFFSMSTTMSNVFVPMINRIVAESDDNNVLTRDRKSVV